MASGVVPIGLRGAAGVTELVVDGVTGLLVGDRADEFVAGRPRASNLNSTGNVSYRSAAAMVPVWEDDSALLASPRFGGCGKTRRFGTDWRTQPVPKWKLTTPKKYAPIAGKSFSTNS
jgi:hypothetical protein